MRYQDGAHADALRAVNVIPRTVADEDAPARVGGADRRHRGAERFWVGLGPVDLAAVDRAVDQVEHAVAAEYVLVPVAWPERVRQDADLEARGAQGAQRRSGGRVGERVRCPLRQVGREQGVSWVDAGDLGDAEDGGAAALRVYQLPGGGLGRVRGAGPLLVVGREVRPADRLPERGVIDRVPGVSVLPSRRSPLRSSDHLLSHARSYPGLSASPQIRTLGQEKLRMRDCRSCISRARCL